MPPMRDPIATEVAKANFPQRPPGPYGAGLKTFNVQANNFLVTKLPENNMFHYDAIQPHNGPSEREITKPKSRLLVNTMQVENPTVFTGPHGAYDGRKNLYLSYKPNINPDGTKISVTLPPRQGRSARPDDDQFYIFIKWAASVDLRALKAFVDGGAIQDPTQRRKAHLNAATAVMFVNEVLRRVPVESDNWIIAGRTFYNVKDVRKHQKLEKHGLVLVPGFFQSVRPCLSGINVTVDSAVGVMYPPIPLKELAWQFLGGKRNARDLSTRTSPSLLATAQGRDLGSFLRDVKVVVKTTQRVKKIMRLVECAEDYHFTDENGDSISLKNYFKRAYNYPLRLPEAFCVQVAGGNTKNPIVYPIELCDVKPGQLYRRTLPPDVTRAMQTMGGMRPNDRLRDIQNGFRQLDFNNARNPGFEVDSALLQVQARTLPRPMLWFCKKGDHTKEYGLEPPEKGNYILKDMWFRRPARITSWGILAIRGPNERQDFRNTVEHFGTELRRVLGGMGMGTPDDQRVVSCPQPEYNEVSVMGDVGAALMGLARQVGNPDLIVVVMPTGAANVQHKIKFWGDVQAGIPTQCVNIEKIRKVKLHNVAMKINVRVGGVNDVLGAKSIPWGMRTAMVVGADVSHPPAGETSQPSVAAVCASTDGPLCEYIATSRVQAGRQENIAEFKEMMMYLLEGFRFKRMHTPAASKALAETNRALAEGNRRLAEENRANWLSAIWPSIILIYRDGVGEGQYATVSDEETRAVQAALAEVKKKNGETDAPHCTLTYIIVSKKHHQRFFPDRSNGDQNGNCFPGAVFDSKVAHPTLFDFYLQSQAAIIGTARPAHYIVCHDDYGFDLDHPNDAYGFDVDTLQQLTYSLCYVYARATRSVSIPAPVYYADVRARQLQHQARLCVSDGHELAVRRSHGLRTRRSLICGRSKFMFEPAADNPSVASSERYQTLEDWQAAYCRPHKNHQSRMYFI